MKRILVVDDERPVVDGISLIVRRELPAEFEVAGSASSGREALEKAMTLAPDIILMDVRMPGISGLEAIREIRARGSEAVFILVTAYERFDIARDAVGLGVLDYLLKPVAKDKLAIALRAAASFLDRRRELEGREIEQRETADRLNAFVEASFLQGIVLGEKRHGDLALYREILGLGEACAMVVAVSFAPAPTREAEVRDGTAATRLHARLRETLRYKTRFLVGPLFNDLCLVLLPLHGASADGPCDAEAAVAARAEFLSVLESVYSGELASGALRLGFGGARSLEEASLSWSEAVSDLFLPREGPWARGAAASETGQARPFDDDERFMEEAMAGSPGKAGLALEILLGKLRDARSREGAVGAATGACDRAGLYRIAALLGAVLRGLARRGLLEAAEAEAMLDMEDLHAAWEGGDFDAAARARLSRISEAMGRAPRWSPPVAKAMAYIKENFGRQISLELAADAVGLSPNRLSRLLVEETGRGFSDILIDYRIEKAKELLLAPGASIKQVSNACGYADPNYFSRLFKKVTGTTPSSFPSASSEASDE